MDKFIDWIYKIDGTITEFVQGIYPGDGILGKLTDILFYLFTCFSEEIILISMIVFIYWCFNKKIGEALLSTLYLSSAVNGIFKDVVQRPRPFKNPSFSEAHLDVQRGDELVDKVHLGESYSFPSGHSQSAGSFWPSLYLGHKKEYNKSSIFKILPFIIIPLVMISRVYLGVHYASDTVVGASLGILCAFLMMKLYYKFYEKRYILIFCVYLLSLIALFFNPTADTLKTMGMGLGGIVGFMLESKYINFTTEGTWKKKTIRLILGISTLLLVRGLFKIILPSIDSNSLFHTTNVTLYNWSGFIRYMIMGLYGTFIYPFVFKKLNI